MSKGVVVFDLDQTLGDFRVIDYFGLIYEPRLINNHDVINNYNSYDKDIKIFLKQLRDNFENTLSERGLDNGILRPGLKDILIPLIKKIKDNKIKGFIIYSNNGNLYNLEYCKRSIEKMFNISNLFLQCLHRYHPLRNTYDKISVINGVENREKTIDTIKLIVPEITNNDILFVDDIIHEDFKNKLNENNYILIPPYNSSINRNRLEQIFTVFQELLEKQPNDIQEKFFKLYHMNGGYWKINNIDTLKSEYMRYSKADRNTDYTFNEDLEMIHKKINMFMIHYKGGRKKKRTRKIKHRKI